MVDKYTGFAKPPLAYKATGQAVGKEPELKSLFSEIKTVCAVPVICITINNLASLNPKMHFVIRKIEEQNM